MLPRGAAPPPWRATVGERRHRLGCATCRSLPLAILVPFVLIAVFANFIAPYDPTEPIPGAKIFEPPFWMPGGSPHALLGTDFQSRDVLSRLIYGARVSLIVGVTGTIVAGSIGTTMGILAGYLGGWVDQVIMRITDAWLALPALVFAIFLATMVGPEHVEHRRSSSGPSFGRATPGSSVARS